MGEDKMKVLLVCPSNTLFMPYLENYTTIFSDNNISYDTLLWNRFGYEERAQYQFTDKKKGHRRNLFDYINYALILFLLHKLFLMLQDQYGN